MDEDTAGIFFKTLKGQGLKFLLNTGVEKAKEGREKSFTKLLK